MKYYVYIYLNPLKPGNFNYKKFNFEYEPFYIGMGKGNRINNHLYNYNLEKRNFKNFILKKILKENLEPIRFKLYENITYESARRLEIVLIKLIGRRDKDYGTLSNLTDGGEGIKGILFNEEMKERLKGKNNSFYNRHHTEQTKQKIRKTIGDSRKGELNSNFNNKWTNNMKELASDRQKDNHIHLKGNNNPSKKEEVRKKISESKMGIKNPNAKKWLLISPSKNEFIIESGIKRNLKLYNLDYQQFKKEENEERKNKKGWILKEI